MESDPVRLDVAIVGGGIAGLAVAHELLKRAPKLEWRLFEASDRLGGKVLTERIQLDEGQFIVEAGPDAFLAQKPWAKELAEELGLGDRLVPVNTLPNPLSILKHGEPIELPDGVSLIAPTRLLPFARSPLLSRRGKTRAALEPVIPRRRDKSDESLGGFVRRRLGCEALEWIAEPLVAGIYNADPDELSLNATFPQFEAMEQRYGSVIRGLRVAKLSTVQNPMGPTFLTFLDGMQELVHELAVRLGERAILDSSVRSLALRNDGGFQFSTERGPVSATSVVLALPARASAAVLHNVAPVAADRLTHLRSVSAGSINLAYRTTEITRPLNGYGLVIPKKEGAPLNAITVASKKFTGRVPDGWTLLRVFFGGARSPQTMQLDDEGLLTLVRGELKRLVGVVAEPAFHRIHRWFSGSPQYDVGHLARVEQIDASLPSGVFVTGSAYRGVGLPDIVYAAQATTVEVLRHLGTRSESIEQKTTESAIWS